MAVDWPKVDAVACPQQNRLLRTGIVESEGGTAEDPVAPWTLHGIYTALNTPDAHAASGTFVRGVGSRGR